MGNGDGKVIGEQVTGTIRWSMYSGNCAYVFVQAGVEPPPGQHLCTVNRGGVIETEDGTFLLLEIEKVSGYFIITRSFSTNYPPDKFDV